MTCSQDCHEAFESFAVERMFAANMPRRRSGSLRLRDKGGADRCQTPRSRSFRANGVGSRMAKRGRPLMRTRPRTAAGVQPTSSTVSSIPGIDCAAPDRTETRSGRRRSRKAFAGCLFKKRNALRSAHPPDPALRHHRRRRAAAQQADREHEGGRHRQTEGGDARKVRRSCCRRLGGIRSRQTAYRCAQFACSTCFLGHQVGEHVLAQQMAKCRQTIG